MMRNNLTPALLTAAPPAEGDGQPSTIEDGPDPASVAERRCSSPALARFRMMAKLSRILNTGTEGDDEPASASLSSIYGKPKPKFAARMGKLRLLCRMRSVLGREIAPRKKPLPSANLDNKYDKKKSAYWRRFPKKPQDAKIAKLAMEPEKPRVDPVVEIRLTTDTAKEDNSISYDLKTKSYNSLQNSKAAMDLLELPSRVLHKKDPRLRKKKVVDKGVKDEEEEKMSQLLVELYGDVMSKEELAKLDTQPNPFNFSDRVAQTPRLTKKECESQTDPSPSTTFSQTVGVHEIYKAYEWDQHLMDMREQEKQRKQKEKNVVKVETPQVVKMPLSVSEDQHLGMDSPRPFLEKPSPFENIPGLLAAAIIVERMLNQNQYDDIAQDFKYWEDGSDEFKPLQGSLLPLWRFTLDNQKSLTVTDVCWSPMYPDLFAAAYIAGGTEGKDGTGLLCLFSLKNPATPERVFPAPCGVTCVHFHPQHCNLVLAGWSDGTVIVYDAKSSLSPKTVQSSTVTGKHILPVSQVRWVATEPCEGLRFFSVALDGRVTKWQLTETLEPTDILLFDTLEEKTYASPFSVKEEIPLEGRGTCLAFCPMDNRIMLVGVDTGEIIQCCTTTPTHSMTRYAAHQAPVRDLSWNKYQRELFLSCSADWTIKIWIQYKMAPLIVLDVGGAVAGVSWTSYSSSVLVAATEEGRVHVYDLFLCKSPLCIQNIVNRRRLRMSCMAFNTSFPVVLLGGEKGHLVTLKLSPNLRQIHKDPRDLQETSHGEIELCKINRLIQVNS